MKLVRRTTSLFLDVSINSAHSLPKVPKKHKCRKIHGHTYRIRIVVLGRVGADGFVIDYDVIRKAWAPLFKQLDHNYLNDVPGLANPTSELIGEWIGARMNTRLPSRVRVKRIEVRETERCGAIVEFEYAGLP